MSALNKNKTKQNPSQHKEGSQPWNLSPLKIRGKTGEDEVVNWWTGEAEYETDTLPLPVKSDHIISAWHPVSFVFSLHTQKLCPFPHVAPSQDSPSHPLALTLLTFLKCLYYPLQIRSSECFPSFEKTFRFLWMQGLTPRDDKNWTPRFWLFVPPEWRLSIFTPLERLSPEGPKNSTLLILEPGKSVHTYPLSCLLCDLRKVLTCLGGTVSKIKSWASPSLNPRNRMKLYEILDITKQNFGTFKKNIIHGKVTAWMWVPKADDQKVRLQNLVPGCLEQIKCGNTVWGRPRSLNSASQ